MADTLLDVNRVQYAKLLALERKEMANQKEISDCWVRYIFLLLETAMVHCQAGGILFSNLDEFQQVLDTHLFSPPSPPLSSFLVTSCISDSFAEESCK